MTSPSGRCLLAPVRSPRPGGAAQAVWPAAVELDVHPVRPEPPVPDVPLTSRQLRILDFIAGYVQEHGYPPSIREIGCGVGLKSLHGVNYQLSRLAELGVLERPEGGCRSRALRLIKGGA